MATKKAEVNGKRPFRLKEYTFSCADVPRLHCADPEVERLILNEQPVIITDTNLVSSALQWDLEYLGSNMGSGTCTVYASDTNKFKYFDDKKAINVKSFREPMRHLDMTFQDFSKKLRERKPGDERLYMQQTLNDTVGKKIVMDFLAFNWNWITEQQKKFNWGQLTANLLLVGTDENITPAHYDEQQNFFAQIRGNKRFILFPPSQFDSLYPYPVYHPHDRQSQVDFDEPDFDKFSKFKDATALQAVVGPGDVLYLPTYWWHQVECVPGTGLNVSVTFWYKCGPTDKIEYPLGPQQKVAMMRNIEKMITQALNDPKAVPEFMQNMVLGRYT